MDQENRKKQKLSKKVLSAVLEILGELLMMAVCCAIGLGIMALFGKRDAVETMDPDLLMLLGSLVILAGFGIVFAIAAAIRKKKKKQTQ